MPITKALITAIMHSTEPMVLTDPTAPDHPMIAINPAFEALTGYAAADTLGRNCRFLQGERTDPATRARIRGHIDARRGCVEWIVNYRRDGTMFWNLLFLSPIFNHDGELIHYFGNQRDISEGPPATLPDYTIGRAQMPPQGEMEFHALLLGQLDQSTDDETSARNLETLVETARRLDQITTGLVPLAWSPG
jgi:PAS domain S-box-containing protein